MSDSQRLKQLLDTELERRLTQEEQMEVARLQAIAENREDSAQDDRTDQLLRRVFSVEAGSRTPASAVPPRLLAAAKEFDRMNSSTEKPLAEPATLRKPSERAGRRNGPVLAALVVGGLACTLLIVWLVGRKGEIPIPDDGTPVMREVHASEPPPPLPPSPGKPPAENRRDTAVPDKNWPKDVSPVKVEEDGVVIDDTHAIAWFDYLDKQRPIYSTKSFKVHNPVLPEQFSGFQFFVKPDLILDQEELDKSFAAKRDTGKKDESGGPIHEMLLEGRIIDEQLKARAAETLNGLFPKAKVTADRIMVIRPYNLQLYVWVGDKAVELSGPTPFSAQVAQTVRIRANGSEKTLQALKDDARFEIRYTVSGYRVRQNISVGSLQYFVRANFQKVMIGDAKYEAISRHRQDLQRAGLDLGFIRFGDQSRGIDNTYKRDTRVTRNIVAHAATECCELIKFHQWLEMPEDKAQFAAKSKDLADRLTGLAKAIRLEIKVPDLAKPDQLVAADVAPDVLGELSGKVTAINNEKRDKKVEAEYQGVKASVDKKSLDENSVEWEEKTGPKDTRIYVPKSITVYDFSDVRFDQVAQQTVVDSSPEWVTMPVAHEPAVVFRTVPRKTAKEHLEGVSYRMSKYGCKDERAGDEDVDADDDGHSIWYEFRTNAVVDANRHLAVSAYFKIYEEEEDHTTGSLSDARTASALPPDFLHLGHGDQPAQSLHYGVRFKHWGGHKGIIDFFPLGHGATGQYRGHNRIEYFEGYPEGTPFHKLLQFVGYGDAEDIGREAGYTMELKIPYTRLVEDTKYQFRTRVTASETWKERPKK